MCLEANLLEGNKAQSVFNNHVLSLLMKAMRRETGCQIDLAQHPA
jgi:hypothetical protein